MPSSSVLVYRPVYYDQIVSRRLQCCRLRQAGQSRPGPQTTGPRWPRSLASTLLGSHLQKPSCLHCQTGLCRSPPPAGSSPRHRALGLRDCGGRSLYVIPSRLRPPTGPLPHFIRHCHRPDRSDKGLQAPCQPAAGTGLSKLTDPSSSTLVTVTATSCSNRRWPLLLRCIRCLSKLCPVVTRGRLVSKSGESLKASTPPAAMVK